MSPKEVLYTGQKAFIRYVVLAGDHMCTVAFSVLFSVLTGGTVVLLFLSSGDGGGKIPFPVWILSLEQCL